MKTRNTDMLATYSLKVLARNGPGPRPLTKGREPSSVIDISAPAGGSVDSHRVRFVWVDMGVPRFVEVVVPH